MASSIPDLSVPTLSADGDTPVKSKGGAPVDDVEAILASQNWMMDASLGPPVQANPGTPGGAAPGTPGGALVVAGQPGGLRPGASADTAITQKGATPSGYFWCKKCCQNQLCALLTLRGNVAWCSHCVNAYGALSGRWRTNKPLKSWWGSLKEEQQVTWFRRQQNAAQLGRKRWYDDMTHTFYGSLEVNDTSYNRDAWIPFSVFLRNKSLEGCDRKLASRQFLDIVRGGQGTP